MSFNNCKSCIFNYLEHKTLKIKETGHLSSQVIRYVSFCVCERRKIAATFLLILTFIVCDYG